jgi:hypothetical protein
MVLPLDDTVPAGGMALAPALALVRTIPLGVRVDLAEAGIPFQIENRSAEQMTLSLVATDPRKAGIAGWEAGFEAPPDMSWFRIEPGTCVVPARSRVLATLIAEIPDRPDLANRHFCVCAVLAPPAGSRIGAGLALAGRLLIETEVRSDTSSHGGMPLSLTPVLSETEGNASRTLVLRNNDTAPRHWKLQPMAAVVPDPVRRQRYAARGTTATDAWSTVVPHEGVLQPGAEVSLVCNTVVPADAAPGVYEELLFASVVDPANDGQPVCTFARLHHRVR